MSFLKKANIQGGARFCHRNFITCFTKIFKSLEDERNQSLPVVGTENNEVIVLDKSLMGVAKTIKVKSVPVFIVTTGCFDIDYKIFVACRNGCTYQIKNGVISASF
jgi:Bardet-Biedl syndrome 1 protein